MNRRHFQLLFFDNYVETPISHNSDEEAQSCSNLTNKTNTKFASFEKNLRVSGKRNSSPFIRTPVFSDMPQKLIDEP